MLNEAKTTNNKGRHKTPKVPLEQLKQMAIEYAAGATSKELAIKYGLNISTVQGYAWRYQWGKKKKEKLEQTMRDLSPLNPDAKPDFDLITEMTRWRTRTLRRSKRIASQIDRTVKLVEKKKDDEMFTDTFDASKTLVALSRASSQLSSDESRAIGIDFQENYELRRAHLDPSKDSKAVHDPSQLLPESETPVQQEAGSETNGATVEHSSPQRDCDGEPEGHAGNE